MLKTEFETMVNQDVSDEEYEKIEKVYMYYPGIAYKSQIVTLYKQFGMVIIEDMLPRARDIKTLDFWARKLETEMRKLKGE